MTWRYCPHCASRMQRTTSRGGIPLLQCTSDECRDGINGGAVQ